MLTKILQVFLIVVCIFVMSSTSSSTTDSSLPTIRPFDDTSYIIPGNAQRRLQYGVVSGRFGDPRNHVQGGYGYPHQGVDYKLPRGAAIRATASGKVEFAGDGGKFGYGWMILIDHGNGIKTRYAHLSKQWVNQETVVMQGMKIGEVGDSGNAQGNHLHYEVLRNGVPVPPSEYVFQ